jgi:NAD(P)-dependent dehydrogenase (short-subunit alcohol dehydrogenase family)
VSARSVIVTGAGQGLGRAHALALGKAGFHVVVNDIGDAAHAVAEEIRAAGGRAVGHPCDVSNWSAAEGLIGAAVDSFGRLDALVNNAGIVRDRMLVGMSEAEWDDVVRIDLKGHFCPLRHAAAHWRDRSKAGEQVEARIVNTSSGAGLMGSVGQGNYAAAKAGVVAMTQVAAVELARYGVTVNALAPAARTPMTEAVFAQTMAKPESGFDAMDPANVSPLVVWLAGVESGFVTGQVFEVEADRLGLCDGWRFGPRREAGRQWQPDELGDVVKDLLAEAVPPTPVYGA